SASPAGGRAGAPGCRSSGTLLVGAVSELGEQVVGLGVVRCCREHLGQLVSGSSQVTGEHVQLGAQERHLHVPHLAQVGREQQQLRQRGGEVGDLDRKSVV